MSRLLHAAARGARIECWLLPQKKWIPAIAVRVADGLHIDYRIHPADAHLQYGPISTVLREVALGGDGKAADIPYVRVEFKPEDGYWSSTEEQRIVFLLILAECLADEGM